MPKPRFISRSAKRVQKRAPGGRLVKRYKRKMVKKAVCAGCGKPLAGVPRLRDKALSKLPKSKKRPSRPYGGNLCPECLKEKIKEKVRGF